MRLDKKILRGLVKIGEFDLKREFWESFAGGAGKAAGMGVVIAIALVMIKLLGFDVPKLP